MKNKKKRNLKTNLKNEFELDKEIARLKEQNYQTLRESHGFMTNGAIGGFTAAIDKMHYVFHVQFLQGFLSGIIIGLAYGAIFAINARNSNPDTQWVKSLMIGVIFPPAIWLITFLGGALFTSHTVATIPVIKGVVRRSNYFKALGSVYLGNFAGTGFIAIILGLAGVFNATGDNTILGNSMVFGDGKLYSVAEAIRNGRAITAGDVLLTIMYVFFSGLLCNLCVSATLPITFSTKSRGTASAVMFFAVFYFAVAGYQHSPANTFFFWTYLVDAIVHPNTTSIILALLFVVLNLIPAAIGNWLSGGIILPGILYVVQKKYVDLLFDEVLLKQYEKQRQDLTAKTIESANKKSKK